MPPRTPALRRTAIACTLTQALAACGGGDSRHATQASARSNAHPPGSTVLQQQPPPAGQPGAHLKQTPGNIGPKNGARKTKSNKLNIQNGITNQPSGRGSGNGHNQPAPTHVPWQGPQLNQQQQQPSQGFLPATGNKTIPKASSNATGGTQHPSQPMTTKLAQQMGQASHGHQRTPQVDALPGDVSTVEDSFSEDDSIADGFVDALGAANLSSAGQQNLALSNQLPAAQTSPWAAIYRGYNVGPNLPNRSAITLSVTSGDKISGNVSFRMGKAENSTEMLVSGTLPAGEKAGKREVRLPLHTLAGARLGTVMLKFYRGGAQGPQNPWVLAKVELEGGGFGKITEWIKAEKSTPMKIARGNWEVIPHRFEFIAPGLATAWFFQAPDMLLTVQPNSPNWTARGVAHVDGDLQRRIELNGTLTPTEADGVYQARFTATSAGERKLDKVQQHLSGTAFLTQNPRGDTCGVLTFILSAPSGSGNDPQSAGLIYIGTVTAAPVR